MDTNDKKERTFTPSRNRLRNLKQHREKTDTEFEEWYLENYGEKGITDDEKLLLEDRIQNHLDKLQDDYDFSDMKANDLIQLRAFALATIQLEDLEQAAFSIRQSTDYDTVLKLERLNNIISKLRSDISSISNDLQLSKKQRNQSKDVSIAARWDELTKKAYEFYQQKMLFVFCTNCRMLLSTVWLLYTDMPSELNVYCKRCDRVEHVELSKLYYTGNKNLKDVIIP